MAPFCPCNSYDASHCFNFSVTIEPVIWAGLGEGRLISEDLLCDELLSHIPGKLVLAVSQLVHDCQQRLASFYMDFFLRWNTWIFLRHDRGFQE